MKEFTITRINDSELFFGVKHKDCQHQYGKDGVDRNIYVFKNYTISVYSLLPFKMASRYLEFPERCFYCRKEIPKEIVKKLYNIKLKTDILRKLK